MDYKRIYFVLLICCSIIAFNGKVRAQAHVDSLIEKGQYLSAYEYLSDQSDKTVDLVLKQAELVMNHHWHSYMYRQFSFINLREGEDLLTLREKEPYGDTPFRFAVDTVLLNLEESYPDDYRIKKALGDYYNRVFYDFGDRWGERSEILIEKSKKYYMEAYKSGVYDSKSLYALGYYQSLRENYFEAQNWFLKSLQENPDNALCNYSLAVTYLFDGLPRKGVSYSKRAYELYPDSLSKSDAARITGILLLKSNQLQEAKDYFVKADDLHENYRPNQLYLLKASVLLDDDSVAFETGYDILLESPYSPDIPNELNSLFLEEKKQNLLYEIYDRIILAYHDNGEVLGNIRFHYGKLLFKEGKKRKSKRMIKQAEQDFRLVFDESHQVFDAIEQTMEYF